MWQNWQFFMAKFANFCGKIWQNLGFQMAIFCDASLLTGPHVHEVIEHFSTEIRMYLRVAAPVQFYPIATSDLMSYHLFTWRDDIKFKATI